MSIFDQKVIKYEMKPLSSLEKVFLDETPVYRMECQMLSGLWGETVSFQVAYTGDFVMRERLDVRVVSELAEHVHVRTVEMVPVGRATNGIVDDNYLKTISGLYPDLLKDLKDGKVIVYSRQWRSLWVDVDITNEIPAGEYEIELQLIKEGEVVCSAKQKVTVIGTELPKLDIMHTEWMHADCLADYYHVEVFSEEHWKLLENYFQEYVKRDCNMMLTPLFTSPLDTAIGLERTTCQLIDVEVKDGEYVFGFAKLKRWIDLCKKCGIEYFEMSHLESYKAAKESLGNMLDGFRTFDALSSYEFYRHGLIDKPVPGNNEIEEFLANGLTDMWTYYCTGQFYEVSNRFMSMPSARNRIYGVQLYKYKIIGVLHWGYNFYNSQYSIEHINPYEVTDAAGAFPSGDPFLVYPGENGQPEESLRMMVHDEAMTDLRALKLLESLTSREHVMELIEGNLPEPLTFKRYPKSDMYLIQLRDRVNREIKELTAERK